MVNLPRDYSESSKRYPVIYLLDAQWDFSTLVSLYGQLNYDGDIPDLIIIGVTWGGEKPNPSQLRIRDFSPTKLSAHPNSGGADKFLAFFKQELIPFVDNKYRSSQKRILVGSSLGGLFTTYTMLKEPELFNAYLLTAIASQWDNEAILRFAKDFKEKTKLRKPIQVYSAYGDLDFLAPNIEKFHSYLELYKPRLLKTTFEVVPNIGHSSIKSIGNLRGLQTIFRKQEKKLTTEQLKRFTGKYRDEDGTEIIVELEEKRLMVTTPDGAKNHFKASSDNEFFRPGWYLTISFDQNTNPDSMKISFYEGELNLSKLK